MKCANCDAKAVWVYHRQEIPFCDSCLPPYLRGVATKAVVKPETPAVVPAKPARKPRTVTA